MAAAVPEVDLVHSHTWYANLAGHLAGLLHDIPHVVSAHSLEPHRPWKAEQLGGGYRLSSWAERTAFEGADAVIAVSAGMRTDILESYTDLDPDKVHVVKNGIDTDEFAPDTGTDIVTGLGIDLDQPSVVFVGRITRQKGLIHLVRAAEQLDPDTQVVLLAGAAGHPGDRPASSTTPSPTCRPSRGNVLWVEEMLPRASGPPGAVPRHRVRLPVGLRAAGHRQPGGDGLRDRRGRLGRRRHPRGGGRRRDRLPGALRPGPGRRPGRGRRVRGRTGDQDQRADRRPGAGRARSAQAGRQRCIDEFSWAKIAAETVEVYRRAIEVHGG